MSLTKAELIERLHLEVLTSDKLLAKEVVEAFFENIRVALENGEEVKLTGFGKFKVRHKVARPGRNPVTGVTVDIAPRKVVTFKASPKLKAAIKQKAVPSGSKMK